MRLTAENGFELRAFVTGAVILAYSYLDAALNEFILRNAIERGSPLSDAEKAIIEAIGSEDLRPRRQPHTLELFNMMLRLLKRSPLAKGKPPYQPANLVRHLRNMLVHPEPGWVVTFSENPKEILSEQQQIVKQLRSHLRLVQCIIDFVSNCAMSLECKTQGLCWHHRNAGNSDAARGEEVAGPTMPNAPGLFLDWLAAKPMARS